MIGRMPWSSNLTILVELADPSTPPREPDDPITVDTELAIYKPHAGERPLWDFPDGLFRREVAAYELARALGWDLVPPTILRDGPHGAGSLQRFVHADPNQHYFTLFDDPAFHDQLRRLALFDLAANSTDRKAGHVLRDDSDHLWAIDNGLSFHAEFKLRTVIWDFAGEHLPSELVEDLDRLIRSPLPGALVDLIAEEEQEALLGRVRTVIAHGRFPSDPTGRRHPWPLV